MYLSTANEIRTYYYILCSRANRTLLIVTNFTSYTYSCTIECQHVASDSLTFPRSTFSPNVCQHKQLHFFDFNKTNVNIKNYSNVSNFMSKVIQKPK